MKAVLIALFSAVVASGQSQPLEVFWSQTPETFAGKSALVQLDSGVEIEGVWTSVTADTFTMKVEKSSNHRAIPKGLSSHPRISIRSLKTRSRRIWRRWIGAVIGYAGVGAIVVSSARSPEAGAIGLASMFAAGAVGYLAGRSLDRATVEIEIRPDSPGQPGSSTTLGTGEDTNAEKSDLRPSGS